MQWQFNSIFFRINSATTAKPLKVGTAVNVVLTIFFPPRKKMHAAPKLMSTKGKEKKIRKKLKYLKSLC